MLRKMPKINVTTVKNGLKDIPIWLLLTVFFSFLIASPWISGFYYQHGNDFFGHVFNAWYLYQSLSQFSIPSWNPYHSAGMPFLKLYGVTGYVIMSPFIALLGFWDGLRAFIIFGYILGGLGMFALARLLTGRDALHLLHRWRSIFHGF